MSIKTTLTRINKCITKLKNSEKITKEVLAGLSRALLGYVFQTHDIASLNRLISVLTPMNKKTSILFFKAFLPFKMDEKGESFTSLNKKQMEKKLDITTDFLEIPSNNIWTWASKNVDVKAKEFDAAKFFTGAIKRSIKGGLSADDMLKIMSEFVETD